MRINKNLIGKIVQINWIDITTYKDIPLRILNSYSKDEALAQCVSYGKVIRISEELLYLSLESDNSNKHNIVILPFSVIHKIKVLR